MNMTTVGLSRFQFYISTIIIPPRQKARRPLSSISILHKYDYNTALIEQSRMTSKISILHKYDYNPAMPTVVSLTDADFNST